MKAADLISFLAEPKNDPDELLQGNARSLKSLVKPLLSAVSGDNKRAKNRAVKLLAALSESNPKSTLPHLNEFIGFLESDSNILVWNAMVAIGHLAAADESGQVESLAPRLKKFFKADSMVTTAHAITALGRIAAASPKQRAKIAGWLTQIDDTPHSDECREILAGKALEALESLVGDLKNKLKVRKFAEGRLQSPRGAVAKKAGKFLKRLDAC